MKTVLSFILVFFICQFTKAQGVGIGTNTPNANAALEIKSNNKGVLMPRVSNAARTGMTNVPKGMMIYDSTFSAFYYHDGNKWRLFSERNTDSSTTSYIDNPQITVNIPPLASNTSTTALSGILYDNGGPSGNYSNNAFDVYGIISDDSTVGFKIIVEQLNLANGDTLAVAAVDDPAHALYFTGTTTGTYYIPATSYLGIYFASNASGNAAGFKLRWSKVNVHTDPTDIPPSYGWYFNPKKIAVRGGLSSNNNWNADSLGRMSFAWGSKTVAKGWNAISIGEGTIATGNYSIAMGLTDTASGDNSIAMGYGSKASNFNSIALGRKCLASGSNAIAMGYETIAEGLYSTAMGFGTRAVLNTAVAMGSYSVAYGYNSIAMGYATHTSNTNAVAMGDSTTADGVSSVAMGNNSFAYGDNSIASGSYSKAYGINSTTAGTGTDARSYSSFVIGAYNNVFAGSSLSTWVPTDPLFIIGNGTKTDLNNAMVVLKNGYAGIGTNTPNTKLHIFGGTDASLSSGSGYFVIGDMAGTNIVFDNNEIIARNNGANSTLFLQNGGGAFEIGGTAAKPGGGSWAATSDARLKENVKPYSDGLQTLLKIKPVYYNYNKQSGYDQSKQYIGVLAQELREIAPYMVGTFKKENDNTEYYNVDNTAMTYMLINAVKEQQEQIKTQQKQIDELKRMLEAKK